MKGKLLFFFEAVFRGGAILWAASCVEGLGLLPSWLVVLAGFVSGLSWVYADKVRAEREEARRNEQQERQFRELIS